MSRAELHGIVANLRAYLEWHGIDEPDLGIPPAPEPLAEAFEARASAREAARLERARSAISGEPPAKTPHTEPKQAAPALRSAPENAPSPGAQKSSATASTPAVGDKPWVKYGPRSRKTFGSQAPKEVEATPDEGPPPQDYDGPPMEYDGPPVDEPPFYDESSAPSGSAPTRAPKFPPFGAGNIAQIDTSAFGWRDGKFRSPPEPEDGFTPAQKLAILRLYLGDCTRCGLCEGRTNIVFGDGAPDARLMFIGEGPGYNEDQQAKPFVGKAGQLLDKMIGAMGFDRSEVYIANVVKCRPPDNRDPSPDEIVACSPFLQKQIAAIEPDVIVTLGRFAAQNLLGVDTAISKMRGKWHDFDGTPVMPTWHPAYLLRNDSEKGNAWNDLKLVMERLGL